MFAEARDFLTSARVPPLMIVRKEMWKKKGLISSTTVIEFRYSGRTGWSLDGPSSLPDEHPGLCLLDGRAPEILKIPTLTAPADFHVRYDAQKNCDDKLIKSAMPDLQEQKKWGSTGDIIWDSRSTLVGRSEQFLYETRWTEVVEFAVHGHLSGTTIRPGAHTEGYGEQCDRAGVAHLVTGGYNSYDHQYQSWHPLREWLAERLSRLLAE